MITFKRRPSVEINSSSMADIAFLLLIFFLVTTTISMDQGLEIVLPSEGNEMKVNPNNITIISINESGKVLFNGRFIKEKSLDQNNLYQLKSMVENELANNEKMIFSVQVTPKTRYTDYIRVLDYVKAAKATKISIAN
ncbi:MAG: biopolymer transporter ExbD [Candidatus Marinimicrobia bacterium]|nr:biopolymer transporter ExbD [Candidatus Neomarinimicrobiota bacterium]|tara:strand:+ start:1239 stop:1652 length:414 start_codon:yes stop_codon:yes gene_type:complete